MRQGSTEVILFVTAHNALIRRLTHFEYVDAYRLDRGAAVREEAEAVVSMLQLFRSEESRGESVQSPVRETSGASTTASSASSSFRPTPSSATTVTYAHSQRPHAQQQGLYSGPANPTQLFPCSPWNALQKTHDITPESVHDRWVPSPSPFHLTSETPLQHHPFRTHMSPRDLKFNCA